MADTHRHDDSERADFLTVLLSCVGLAGLFVSAAVVAASSTLWPSFSGERVYMAAHTPASAEETLTTLPAKAPVVVSGTPAAYKVESRAPRVCPDASRIKQPEQTAERRAPSRGRARQLSRRPPTPPAPNV